MTNTQLNTFDTCVRILGLLKGEPVIVAKYSEFGVYLPLFETSINKTRQLNVDYTNATKGVTEAKRIALRAVYLGVLPVKRALLSLAHKNSDEVLKAIASITNSSLENEREEKFVETAGSLISAAKKNLPFLGGFNLTQEKLDALQAKLDGAGTKKDEQGKGFNDRNALWKSLNNELETIHEILTIHLDAIAACTQEEDVNFYNKYQAARVIVDRGGSHGGDDGTTPPPAPPAQ